MTSLQLLKLLKSGSRVKFFNKIQHIQEKKLIQLLNTPIVMKYLKSEDFNNSIYNLLPKSIRHLPFLVKRYQKKSYAYHYLPLFIKNKNNIIVHNLKKDPLIYLELSVKQKRYLPYIYICAKNFISSYEKYQNDPLSTSGVMYEEALFIKAIPPDLLAFFNISVEDENSQSITFRKSYQIIDIKNTLLHKDWLEHSLSIQKGSRNLNKI